MSRHVMECLGMSRVTIQDGKVVEVTEPKVRYCPLFAKRRGMEELNRESIKENIEYRISSFGMCTEDRVTAMNNFLNFGISETLCSALKNGKIDADSSPSVPAWTPPSRNPTDSPEGSSAVRASCRGWRTTSA